MVNTKSFSHQFSFQYQNVLQNKPYRSATNTLELVRSGYFEYASAEFAKKKKTNHVSQMLIKIIRPSLLIIPYDSHLTPDPIFTSYVMERWHIYIYISLVQARYPRPDGLLATV